MHFKINCDLYKSLLKIRVQCLNVVFMKMQYGHVTFFFKVDLVILEMMQFSCPMLENMMNKC